MTRLMLAFALLLALPARGARRPGAPDRARGVQLVFRYALDPAGLVTLERTGPTSATSRRRAWTPRDRSPGTRPTAATWTAGSDLATNGLQIRPSQPYWAAVLAIDPAKI
jgi:hypothetical protein